MADRRWPGRVGVVLGLVGFTVVSGVGLGLLLSNGHETSAPSRIEPLPSFALPSEQPSQTPMATPTRGRTPASMGEYDDEAARMVAPSSTTGAGDASSVTSSEPTATRTRTVQTTQPADAQPSATSEPTRSRTVAPRPTDPPRPDRRRDRPRPNQGFPPHVEPCGGGVGAGPLATCRQARQVARQIRPGANGVFLVETDDPSTGERSTYTCVATSHVLCTGGRGVSIYVHWADRGSGPVRRGNRT